MKYSIKIATIASLIFTAAAFCQAQGPIKPAADGTISGGKPTLENCTTEQTAEGLNVTFLTGGGKWCKAAFAGPFDLTGYTAIEFKITNVGTVASKISVRADNPGNVKDTPWNMGVAYDPVEPGETKILRIDFGFNNFREKLPSYPLNPADISQIMLTMSKPSVDGIIFRIESIKAVK